MKDVYQVIRGAIVTEKGVGMKENQRTLCLEVDPRASKSEIRQAVEKIFKVKVEGVRTAHFRGKERRRGRFSGFRPDWKKAFVKLKEGEKMVDFAAHV